MRLSSVLGVSESRGLVGKMGVKTFDWAGVVLDIGSTEIPIYFYHRRGTAEHWIKEGKHAVKMPQPWESLRTQKPGWSIACRRGWVYVIGWPGSQNGNPGL